MPDASGASVGPAGLTSVALDWTAPGDDGSTGTASVYDVRYSTSPIDDANFASATQAVGEPAPSSAGTTESFVVEGLNLSTTYHFALKVSDNVGNESALSNVAVGATDIARVIFFDDAETTDSDTKWTADPPWARTTEDASPDGAPGVSGGSWSWTDSPGGNYANGADTRLVSNAFSLADGQGTILLFDHKYDIEANSDFGDVDVSTDGGATWTNIAQYSGTLGSWETVTLDLSAFDGMPSVQVRFRLTTDGSVTRDGWHIDDISVLSELAASMGTGANTVQLGDPVTLNLDLQNQKAVAGIDYEIQLDDPDGFVTYMSSQLTSRTTGFTHDVEFDGATGILSGILFEPGGGTIAIGNGPVVEHQLSSAAPANIADLPTSAVEVDAPADPNARLPRIFVGIDATINQAALSDTAGNPILTDLTSGRVELDMLNTDVDFNGAVEVADLTSMINNFLGDRVFTDMEMLIADAFPDMTIDVIDVVRGVNIILGRPIGTAATDLVALNTAPADGAAGGGRAATHRVDFALAPGFGSDDDASAWIDLTGEIPDGAVTGFQVTVRYDPSRLSIAGASLALDDRQFQLATRQGTGQVTYMIFSPEARVLRSGQRTLLRLRAEPTGAAEDGGPSVADLEFVRAVAVDVAGRPVSTNVSPIEDDAELAFDLGLTYPNPFTPATGTRFELSVPRAEGRLRAAGTRVTVQVYSLRGRLVRTLVDQTLSGGRYSYAWDGTNERGATVNSGVYLLLMRAGDYVERRRMVLIR